MVTFIGFSGTISRASPQFYIGRFAESMLRYPSRSEFTATDRNPGGVLAWPHGDSDEGLLWRGDSQG